MKQLKSILVLLTLFFYFTLFNIPSYATTPVSSETKTEIYEEDSSTEEDSLWEKFIKWLFSFRKLFAKKYVLDLERDKLITEFSIEDTVTADVSTRAISENIRDEMKMDYLKKVLAGELLNFDLSKCDSSGSAVTIKDLAEYKINKTPPTKGSIECYDKIYIESYSVPQGNQEEAINSENMNKVIRTPIPHDSQAPVPAGTSSYKKNTAKQTKIFYKNMIPGDSSLIDDDELPKLFSQWLRPQNEK